MSKLTADLLTALALVLVIEGGILALFPGALKRAWALAMDLPEENLRVAGLVAAVAGVGFVWLIRA